MGERVTLFGDIRGIATEDIRTFVAVTSKHQLGGSYPHRVNEIPDKEIIAKNRDVLIQAGIPDCPPIVPCDSIQERAKAVLSFYQQHCAQNGLGGCWVIDRDPVSFAKAINSANTINPVEKALLKSITVLNLGSPIGFDCRDQTTGVRTGALPHPLTPYPPYSAF